MTIRILLADDHRIMREGLRSLLQGEPDIEVIAEVENGRKAVKLANKLKPDVVIMDVNMPELNGMEATRQIMSEVEGVKVIALSMMSDRRFVLGMLKSGVSGYLLKDCAFEEMAVAIRTVMNGQTYLSPAIAGTVSSFISEQSEASGIEGLTPREREVLQLIAEGHSSKDIAGSLNVSIKTVETHRQNIMKKLKLGSVAELTKFALREGLTSLD